jgi:hypothetical protein
MEEIEKEAIELERQLMEMVEKVMKKGAPTTHEKARILTLFRELQVKLGIMQGLTEEEAYKRAEEATEILGEAMCIVVKEE